MSKATSTDANGASYIEWSPVIAGAFVSLAITSILIPFGSAVGLTIDTPLKAETARGMVFGISLWIFWTQLIASMVGAYITGKTLNSRRGLTAYENEFRDGAHGLVSWCLGTVAAAGVAGVAAAIAALVPEQAAEATGVAVNETLVKQSGVIFGFGIAASSLVSAVAAWILATIGGDHRDEETDLSKFFSFGRGKKRKK